MYQTARAVTTSRLPRSERTRAAYFVGSLTAEEPAIKIASAYIASPAHKNNRGIDPTDWIPFVKTLYDDRVDPKNYFPKRK